MTNINCEILLYSGKVGLHIHRMETLNDGEGIMNSTIKALMQRGIDSRLAKQLYIQGYTLSKLKQTPKEELVKLDIPEKAVEMILDEARPPIPDKVFKKVLYDSRYTCCICRDRSKPIVVHHIVPWELSRSHDESNLVVLCLEHHGEAHTKRELSINLTPERIKDAKHRWLQMVEEMDKDLILNITRSESGYFDYFNIFRIFEAADHMQIDLTEVKYYSNALSYGFIDRDGFPLPMKYWSNREMDSKHYWLDFFEGGYFYLYLKNLFITMTEKINFVNLNKIWNRTDIRSILKPGDFVFLQGAFYFKSITKNVKGLNQLKLGYRRAKGIRLEFEIDAFYCNSSSSKSHLSGRNVKTVYCLVRSISYELQQVVIKCTALAIGTGLNRLDSSFMFEEEEIMEPNGLSEIIHG